jgi:hypothetical protein
MIKLDTSWPKWRPIEADPKDPIAMKNAYGVKPIPCEEPQRPLEYCPKCGAKPFSPFLRGQVQKSGWSLLVERWRAWRKKRPLRYCALICWTCKEIVDYE